MSVWIVLTKDDRKIRRIYSTRSAAVAFATKVSMMYNVEFIVEGSWTIWLNDIEVYP